MSVVRQLAQAILLLGLLGCLAWLLDVVLGDPTERPNDPNHDTGPVWVRDPRGGGVLPGGDVGGDTQVDESFSVRFHHRDRPGALVTYCFYAVADPDQPAAVSVERQTEYLVCTDPTDPGGTEIWSDYCFATLQPDFATVQAATDAAHQHLLCEESWSGQPPWESA